MTESEKQFVLRVGSFFVTFVLAAATGHWIFIVLALLNLGLSFYWFAQAENDNKPKVKDGGK